MEVSSTIRSILAKQVSVPVESLTAESRLEDIGFQSIDVIETIFALEEQFDIEIPFDSGDVQRHALDTVGDVERTVTELLGRKRNTG